MDVVSLAVALALGKKSVASEEERAKLVEQLLTSEIGDLSHLQTEAKNNLVAAINEALDSGGGTRNHTQLTNRDAVNQHPISAIEGLFEALNEKGTYSKPTTGIPEGDLAQGVKDILNNALTEMPTADDIEFDPESEHTEGSVAEALGEQSSAIDALKTQLGGLTFSVVSGILTITYDDGEAE